MNFIWWLLGKRCRNWYTKGLCLNWIRYVHKAGHGLDHVSRDGHNRELNTTASAVCLEKLYNFKDSIGIRRFLFSHLYLGSLLIECFHEINKVFGSGRLNLELFSDSEGTQQKLFVIIPTALAVKTARGMLRRLDENWWLDASHRSKGHLNIDLEYS